MMADRLGGGGTSAPLDVYGEDAADGKVQATRQNHGQSARVAASSFGLMTIAS
jgi:hypothetical protein